MSKRGKKIPIKAAKELSQQYGYTQLIIVAWDRETCTYQVTTYGETKKDCDSIAQVGDGLMKAIEKQNT